MRAMREVWMVVRRSRKIPGGYRVVKHGLTEQEAIKWAASYKTPHEAMSNVRLVEIRTAALAEQRSQAALLERPEASDA